jgi:hypothetical protein
MPCDSILILWYTDTTNLETVNVLHIPTELHFPDMKSKFNINATVCIDAIGTLNSYMYLD